MYSCIHSLARPIYLTKTKPFFLRFLLFRQILHSPPAFNSVKRIGPRSMNIKARREELERISIDNRFILERIQRTTANFDRHTLDKAAKLQEKYVMQMSAFANGRRGNDKSKFVPIKPMKQPRPQSAMPSTKAGSEASPSGGTGAAGSSTNYLSYGNGAAGKGVSAVRAAASLRPSSAPVSSSHPQIFNSTAPPGSLQMDQLQLQLFRQQQQLLGSL